jgi:hypothetical protein
VKFAADTLEAVRDRADLQGVISRFVDLKKQGKEYVASCPFHADETPSFTVNQEKGFFHCFGCGAHGNAIDFLMRHQGRTFVEAVKDLAAEAGVVIESGKPVRAQKPPVARFVPAPPPKVGHQDVGPEQLRTWQAGIEGAGSYLAGRGIPVDVARRIGAGYLPAGQAMGLNQSGKPTGWGPRIVFPHTLPDARLVNLYGRSTDPDAQREHRHRHLPQPKGLLNAAAMKLPGPLYLVEGAFDALALMAAGVEKVVAVFGLDGFDWRWVAGQDLVIALDFDEAGEVAAQKLLMEAAYRGLKARRLAAQDLGGEKDVAAAWQAGKLNIGPPERPRIGDRDTAGVVVAPAIGVDDESVKSLDVCPDIVKSAAICQDGPVNKIGYKYEIDDEPPAAHLADRWAQYRVMAARLATFHLDEAQAAGWTIAELFSLPWSRNGTGGGAAWAFCGFDVDRITFVRDCIGAHSDRGCSWGYYRAEGVTGTLPWANKGG